MVISINKVDEKIRQKVIDDYINGKSMRQIEQEYGINRATLSKYLTKHHIKTTVGNHFRTYHHQEDFFEKIDTEEKAYWLGFMFADGYISNNEHRYGEDQFGLSLSEVDIDVLYKFKDAINASNPIHTYIRSDNNSKPLCRIQLTSQRTVDDLISHGCIKQKSHILEPPKGVPDELIHHFIRGFFDGDGSIIKSRNENYKKTNGYVYSIDFTTTEMMANWLQSYFDMGSVIKDSRKQFTYYYNLGGHQQVIKFFHLIYNHATIYMERKYLRFKELLNKYEETQGIDV